jgi:hypothetical protein
MKFKYIPAVALGLTALMQSCDVTELSPFDSMTDKSYWNSTADLELYANGLLGNLGQALVNGDQFSDVFVNSSTDNYLFGYMTVNNATGWDFGTIRQCNYFMDNYERVLEKGGDEATVNQYVGEIRFYRAQRYYAMIRNFGDVQYYDHVLKTTDTEELYKARDPRNFVLGKIIEDLEFAAQWCIEDKSSGRPTKDSAKTLLARVCLYYGTYMKYHNEAEANGYSSQNLLEKARALSQEIIDSNKYAIVKAANPADTKSFEEWPLPYANLFVQDNLGNCDEAILPRYYKVDVVTHQVGRQAGGQGFGLSKAFIESFLMADGTPIYNAGSGYKGDNTIADEIEGRDPRLWQIIPTDRRPNWTYISEDMQMTGWNYGASVTPSAGLTGYPCMKFHSSNYLQQQPNNSYFDWFIFRYAEVLLINAEANAELGTCTQAVLDATINQLRDRVDMAHLSVSPVADAKPLDYGYAVSPLIYEIRRERAIELINEGFRMDDLKRWNAMKLLENPLTMLGIHVSDEAKAFYGDPDNGGIEFGKDKQEVYEYEGKLYLRVFTPETMFSEGRKWTQDDKRWLYPIPLDQVRLNPNLKQNPGWQ